MQLIRLSTRNPAALLATAVLILTFGILAVVDLPIQMLPNLEYAEINVSEASIIKPQEEALRGIPGMVEMSSSVRAGGGNINLLFDVGTDLQQAMIDVLSALNNTPDTGRWLGAARGNPAGASAHTRSRYGCDSLSAHYRRGG
jgi:multidrug efflux pump subunit AcrB